MCIDHRHGVLHVVEPGYLLMLPRSGASEVVMTSTMSIVESHREDRMSCCGEGESEFDGDQMVSLGSY